jgi:GNAT superfamily N-acetyltransferase
MYLRHKELTKIMTDVPGYILIREMTEQDCSELPRAFSAQGWSKPPEQFERYLAESASGERQTFVAAHEGEFAGYATVVWRSKYPPFVERSIPELVDLNVLIKFRNRGIASRLIEAAEAKISSRSKVSGIRVGLTSDYAAAHQLYIRRGYRPDGRGIFYADTALNYGDTVSIDDNLTIAMTKDLEVKAG